jgi:4-hydroxy-tetrahydrodipicolinate synthase
VPINVPIHGCVTALITPFKADTHAIDFDALKRLLDWHALSGSDALVLLGSTGEAAMLTRQEYSDVLQTAVKHVDGRLPLLAGTGLSGTSATIELAAVAEQSGVLAQLVVTPPYVRPTQDGLLRHYSELAERSRLPIMLYNVPSRTGVDLLPETVARLATHPRIFAIKEALPDMARIRALVALQSETFDVLSGDDPSALDALKLGARGLVSVAGNALPASMHELVAAALKGNFTHADRLQGQLETVFAALNTAPNPIPIKWLCAARGLCSNAVRLPLLAIDQATDELAALLAHASFANELGF